MIPANLTHSEVGAVLIVVGTRMLNYDVTAGVVLLGIPEDTEDYFEDLAAEIQDAYQSFDPMPLDRAHELTKLTLEEAISFNEAEARHAAD